MFKEPLSLDQLRLILTPLEWYERAHLAFLYFHIRKNQNPEFSMKEIAEEIGVSRVYILESILLDKFMTDAFRAMDRRSVLQILRNKGMIINDE